ncbi:MAG: Uncharacterized protein Athens071425_49 [Parcubacteria group bacterium Athens0714_25]|nr:MAG: Uncharacterized protein Athens071425_49 [Parcubacteria group bacterium Athens0714_25]
MIIFIYILIFSLVVFGVYEIFKPKPACNDGIANQGEEKVDCGGPCTPCEKEISADNIEIIESGFVYGGENNFDVYAKVKNPNHQYGSSSFDYNFVLKDSSGNVLGQRNGKSFILPYETKYIIETNINSGQNPDKMELLISNIQWEEFSGYEEPALGIYNKHFSDSGGNAFSGEAVGLLRNESYFDFDLIKINIILRNSQEEVIAVSTSTLNTIKSREEREFRITWPYRFTSSVQNFEAEAEADVYDSDNFIKGYLTGRRFQEN